MSGPQYKPDWERCKIPDEDHWKLLRRDVLHPNYQLERWLKDNVGTYPDDWDMRYEKNGSIIMFESTPSAVLFKLTFIGS